MWQQYAVAQTCDKIQKANLNMLAETRRERRHDPGPHAASKIVRRASVTKHPSLVIMFVQLHEIG